MPLATEYALMGLVGGSLVSIFLYWHDKRAARQGRWRTSEKTLHLVALLGGWPGAWFAQRLFRHKTVKQPFRFVFWCTVLLNVGVLVWLHTPSGELELRRLLPSQQSDFDAGSHSIEWSRK